MYRRQQPYGIPGNRRGRSLGTGRFKIFLFFGLIMFGYQAFKYFTNTQVNPITGEVHRVQWTSEQEIQLGIQSAPQMAAQHGGLHPDQSAQDLLDQVGERLVRSTIVRQSGYPYDFHLLADPNVVNAFALPGGQIFITAALFSRLQNEDQLAGIIGHEIGHVIHRHGAERMAKSGFIQGIIQSIMLGSGGDPSMAQVAGVVGNYVNLSYGRDQELESDDWGVRLMIEAGYDPEALISVMDILEEASGGRKVPEFQSSHPSPENRREMIKAAIERYKNG